jgi:hypothetical protein
VLLRSIRASLEGFMRAMIATAVVTAALSAAGGAGAAHAEKRLFIVANNGDGYGIDRCLAASAPCGAAAANAYCHAHEFGQALSYRKVDRDDITGAIPASASGSCRGAGCDEFVAIECSR